MTGPFRPDRGSPYEIWRHPRVPTRCPGCGRQPDAARLAAGRPDAQPPADGDFSICFGCGEVAVYQVGPFGVLLREATLAELAEFTSNPANTEAVRALHAFNRREADGG